MAEYLAGAEGFDIYNPGATTISNYGFPWKVLNSTLAPTIINGQGAFGGNAFSLPMTGAPTAMTAGTALQFNSTMTPTRGNLNVGGSGVFAVNFWLYVNKMNTTSGTLLGLGTSANSAVSLPLLNISNSSTAGLNLQFVTNVNSPTSTPYNFSIQLQTWYWVTVSFAYYSTSSSVSTGTFVTSASVNGMPLVTDRLMTWSTDVFSAGQIANYIQFYGSSNIQYLVDDFIVQSVSSADVIWPALTNNPTPETIPNLPARRIWAIQASDVGSNTNWIPSGTEPNYESATDPSGQNFITATDTGLVDTYVWECPAVNNINAVVVKGNSNRYQNVSGVSCDTFGSQPNTMGMTYNGASSFVSISENDSTGTQWSSYSINNGEFGLTSK